jgi:hypothetical protein
MMKPLSIKSARRQLPTEEWVRSKNLFDTELLPSYPIPLEEAVRELNKVRRKLGRAHLVRCVVENEVFEKDVGYKIFADQWYCQRLQRADLVAKLENLKLEKIACHQRFVGELERLNRTQDEMVKRISELDGNYSTVDG